MNSFDDEKLDALLRRLPEASTPACFEDHVLYRLQRTNAWRKYSFLIIVGLIAVSTLSIQRAHSPAEKNQKLFAALDAFDNYQIEEVLWDTP